MSIRRTTPLEPEEVEPESCTVDLRLRLLAQVPFFADLSPAEIAEVNRLYHDHGYQADEMIYMAGDPATHLYVVAAGKVKLLRHTMAGQDILLDILQQGDFFGTLTSLGDTEYPDTAQALTQSCILNIDAERFQAILRRYPAVALRVLNIVTQRLHEAHETVRHLSAHSVESRVALILVRLADKLGKQHEEGLVIQVPLSRQELAEMSGTTLETASRVVSQFRRAGLISSGREWVAVVDRERLAAIASGEAAGSLAAG